MLPENYRYVYRRTTQQTERLKRNPQLLTKYTEMILRLKEQRYIERLDPTVDVSSISTQDSQHYDVITE